MSIEESRKRWKREKEQSAEAQRTEQEKRGFHQEYEAQRRENLRRSEDKVTIYNAVVSAFGEDHGRKIKWSISTLIPPRFNEGDLAHVGDLKLFAYCGSLGLYESKGAWVRIDERPVTAEMIFTAETELKKRVAEAEQSEHEEEAKQTEREIENARWLATIKKQSETQEKLTRPKTFSNLWNRLKTVLQTFSS